MGNQAAATQQAPPLKQPTRLAAVTRGKISVPDRVLIYGTEGCGKSTWAAAVPACVFVPAEDGTSQLDVARLPAPQRWQDILDSIEELRTEKHDFHAVVFDTLDAIEPLLWQHICQRDKQKSIESYGYGKGYVAALDEWRVFLSALERLRQGRGLAIVMIAHSVIRTFKNPEGEDFDRYELKLNAKAGGLLKEWCDSVLFAHYETFATKSERTGHSKGISTGARVISTQRTAAWDAKNRYSLPDTLPLNYDDYATATKARRPADPEKFKVSIAAKLAELADERITGKVTADLAKAGDDASELAKIDNRLSATLNARTKGV